MQVKDSEPSFDGFWAARIAAGAGLGARIAAAAGARSWEPGARIGSQEPGAGAWSRELESREWEPEPGAGSLEQEPEASCCGGQDHCGSMFRAARISAGARQVPRSQDRYGSQEPGAGTGSGGRHEPREPRAEEPKNPAGNIYLDMAIYGIT